MALPCCRTASNYAAPGVNIFIYGHSLDCICRPRNILLADHSFLSFCLTLMAFLRVTHTREELALADIVYYMEKGRIFVEGPPEAILPIIDCRSDECFADPME